MLEHISANSIDLWNSALSEIPAIPVYYKYNYCKAFELNGDGQPMLLKYSNEDGIIGVCVIMKRDISEISFFKNKISKGELYDAVTPYGYGGFIFNKNIDLKQQDLIGKELVSFLNKEKIISLFVRFSPVLNNVNSSRGIINAIDLGHTIAINLDNLDSIWTNFTSQNRNKIRKAEKIGVEIRHGKGMELINQFIPIYETTMDKDHASDYYYFNKSFYQSINDDLRDNYEIFYAVYENRIIAASIMLFEGTQMEYHLSGSLFEYRNLAAGNLLLYKAALWGHEQGFKTLHLGGGVGSDEDSLYKFKASFNRNSNYRFSIGKLISDTDKYNLLVHLRESSDTTFDKSSNFFPLYRS